MNQDHEWNALIDGLKSGDAEICRRFWQRYGGSLEAIAAKQLSGRLQRRVGADDIVQSVFRTFFRRVSDGQFELADADMLWRLMCAITLTKAREAARHHGRRKRGLQQEVSLSAKPLTDGGESEDWQFPDPVADSRVNLELADEMEALVRNLGHEECLVLEMKMNHLDNHEIATKLTCSERTVRRLINNITDRWQSMVDELLR